MSTEKQKALNRFFAKLFEGIGENKVLKTVDGINPTWESEGGGGVDEFIELTDAPSSYSGQTLKVVRVKADETGLEFATISGSGLTFKEVFQISSLRL